MLTENYGNASSLHSKGFYAQRVVEETRELTAEQIGAETKEIFFTSGGTEANNLAVLGTAFRRQKIGNKIITSAVEHSSVVEACKYLQTQGFEVVCLPVDKNGAVSIEDIAEATDSRTILISLMYANNETGTIQPVDSVRSVIRQKKSPAYFHIDAVQAFGKIPFKNTKLKADMISLSGHKIHAPKGIGALYVKKGTVITPRQYGGEQQEKIRPGTESTPLIAGLGQAIREIHYSHGETVRQLNAYLRERLSVLEEVTIHSPQDALAYILNFSVRGIKSETMMHFLENKNIYVSSGSACAKGKQSYVLQAMGLNKSQTDTALRVSFSRDNTKEEIDIFVDVLSAGIHSIVGRQ